MIHEREQQVREAERRIEEAVEGIVKDLTVWETVAVVSNALGGILGRLAKYEIRYERHGNYDQEGGLA